jgi:hypothetical protein
MGVQVCSVRLLLGALAAILGLALPGQLLPGYETSSSRPL